MESTMMKRRFAPLALVLGALLASAALGLQAAPQRASKHAKKGITCANCHGSAKKPAAVEMEKCLECHGDTKDLAAKTANVKPRNPHESRHYGTEAECGLCHREHTASENHCLPCHSRFDFKVP